MITVESEKAEFAMSVLAHLNIRCMSAARLAKTDEGYYAGELAGHVDSVAWLLNCYFDGNESFDSRMFAVKKGRLTTLFITAGTEDFSAENIGLINTQVLGIWKGV
jgi:hypothetical protein